MARLNNLLVKLRDKGNPVLVVEHDPDVMAIGLDSLAHHRDRATFIGDRRARNRLELLGVKVLLFTWWDYTEHPERLVAQVRAALATTAA